MEKVIKLKIAKTESGYCATTDLIPAFIVAVTGSFEELKKEIKESLDFYVACAKEDHEKYPAILDSEYKFEYVFDIESLLYCYQNIFSRAALSRITGINEKQISHYACGVKHPRKAQAEKIVYALHNLGQELLSVSV